MGDRLSARLWRQHRLTALLARLAIVIASVVFLTYVRTYAADCLNAYTFASLKWESSEKRAQLALFRCIAHRNLDAYPEFEREIGIMKALARASAAAAKRPRDPEVIRSALLQAGLPRRDADAIVRFSGLMARSGFVRRNLEAGARARVRVQRQAEIGYEVRQELLSRRPDRERLDALQNQLESIDAEASHDADDFRLRIRSLLRGTTMVLLFIVAGGTLVLLAICFVELRGMVLRLAKTEANLRERDEQLHQARKLDALGRLAGGVAHDFNNLLMVISSSAEVLLGSLQGNSPGRDLAFEILRATKQGTSLTKQLLVFGRNQVLEKKILELDRLIEENRPLVQRLVGAQIELKCHLKAGASTIEFDSSQFTQMLLNLAANARDAMPEGGELSIATYIARPEEIVNTPHLPHGHVVIEVSDQGAGMSEETLVRLFEPFFTTKETGRGTGLGLAMVYGILKQSQGLITVESEPHQGTIFRIYLPRSAKAAILLQPKTESKPRMLNGETILLVEDQPALRKVIHTTLESDGYLVLAAKDGEEAIELAQRQIGPIHLLLTDVVMPRMSGRELAKRLRSLAPEVLVIYMSGYAPSNDFESGVIEAGSGFLQKPCPLSSIRLKIRQMLDSARRDRSYTA